jgi:hypothetical protein
MSIQQVVSPALVASTNLLRELYREAPDKNKPGAIACDPEAFDSIVDCIGLADRCAQPKKKFIVVSGYGWGVGATIKEAKKKCKDAEPWRKPHRPTTYQAKLVHLETKMNSMTIEYPVGCPPIELGEV